MSTEIQVLLEYNCTGIFIKHIPTEFQGDKKHKTEQDMFDNGQLLKWINNFPNNKFILILNNIHTNNQEIQEFIEKYSKFENVNCFDAGYNIETLYEIGKRIIELIGDKNNEI
jgi:hypothetical protein